MNSEPTISCPKCQRLSPPTRSTCLYCGADLPIIQAEALQKRQKLETWEYGYNLIFLGQDENYKTENLEEVTRYVDVEKESLERIIELQKQLPLVRVRKIEEAELLMHKLSEHGIRTRIIEDETLNQVPRRLHRIDINDEEISLILFGSKEVRRLSKASKVLIVKGTLYKKQIKTVSDRKRRQSLLKDSVEFDEDEVLIDIHVEKNLTGYRILASGFDFSRVLESEKRRLAVENLPLLIKKLLQVLPNARLIDDYDEIYALLSNVWEFDESRSSIGWRRKSFGGYQVENEIQINNFSQFTKYSRLQWYLNNE